MAIRVHDDVANAACDAAVGQADVGSTNPGALVQLWSGDPPENLATAPAGDLLAEFELGQPAFGDAGDGLAPGVAEANGLPMTVAGLATGEVGFARVLNRDEVAIWDDGDVGSAGSAIVVTNTLIEATADVNLISYFFRAAPPDVG